MKRTLSVVLSVLMILSCCSALFAVFAEGPQSGTYPILSALGYGEDDITILAGKIEGKESTTVVERSAYTHASDYLPGDANGNKKIDAQDYAMIKRHYLKTYTLAEDQFQRSDINLNGKIDAAEYAMVKRHYLGNYKLPESVEIVEPGKTYDDYVFIVVGADNKVISVDASENSKGETAIPEGGYIIGFNKKLVSGDAAKYDISAIKEGTELKLEGVTVEEVAALTAPKALENASFSVVTGEILVDLPAEAIAIDFVGYEHAAATSLVAGDGQTIGEITARGNKTNGVQKDMNYAYNILVNKDNVVIATDYKIGVACPFQALPEGAYIISYNCNKAGYEVMADIKVGDIITLYNVDPAEARTIQGSRALTQAGFTYAPAPQPDVYELEIDVDEDPVLTDGVTGFEGGWGDVGTSKVHLAQNAECTEKAMSVSLIKKFDAVKVVRSITLDLYHDANVMIGYPEGKAVVYASADGTAYDLVGEYELAAAELELGKHGTVSTKLDLGSVTAKAVKVVLYVGSSTEVLGENPAGGKVFWEFISIAEFAVEADEGIDLLVSHLNLFNWTTFEAMLIIKTDTISTVMDIPNGSNFDAAQNIMYVVELQDGKYIATKFVNDESMKTTEAPANGFLLFLNPANAGYELGKDGALLNAELVIMDFTLEGTLVIDTHEHPENARHILVVKNEEPVTTTAIVGAKFTAADAANAPAKVHILGTADGENFFDLNAGGAIAVTEGVATLDFSSRARFNVSALKAVDEEGNEVEGTFELTATTEEAVNPEGPYPLTGLNGSGYGNVIITAADVPDGIDINDNTLIKSGPEGDKIVNLASCQEIIAEEVEEGVYMILWNDLNDWQAKKHVNTPEGIRRIDYKDGIVKLTDKQIIIAIMSSGSYGTANDGIYSATKWIARGLKAGDFIILGEDEFTLAIGEPYVQVDSLFEGEDWAGEWIKAVPGENAGYQNANSTPAETAEEKDRLLYDYKYFIKDGVLYVGAKFNQPLTKGTGNGNSTFFRVWLKSNPDAEAYTHFYDVYVNTAGEVIATAKRNKALDANSGEVIADTQFTGKMQEYEGFVEAMVAVPLTEINATDYLRMFVNCAIEKGTGGATGNQCLLSPALATDDIGPLHITGGGKNQWIDDVGNYGIPVIGKIYEKLPEGAIVIDYAGYKHAAFTSILAGDGKTVAELTALGNNGTAKDLNYAYNILVDKDNKVIATDFELGVPCTFVCPEGGYIISYNGNKAGYADMAKISVGDTITLYNVDLEAVRALEGNEELVQAGFTYTPHDHEPVSRKEGSFYFVECGICGARLKITDKYGNEATALRVSHNNTYSWGVYDINIISEAGKVATEYNSGNAFLYAHFYVVENVEGEYVVTKYFAPGSAENNTTPCPEGGFLMGIWTSTRSEDKSTLEALADGNLLNHKLFADFDLTQSFSRNTTGDDGYGNLDPSIAAEPYYLYAIGPDAYEVTVNVKDNAILTDGKTGFDGAWGTVGTGDVLLVSNAKCTQIPMVVEIIDDTGVLKKIKSVTVDLYHDANVMIGYPEGKAIVSVSSNGVDYTEVGQYDLAESGLALGAHGTVSNKFEFEAVEARYVKVVLSVGKSTAVLGDTPADGKIFWEFISIAEVNTEVVYDEPLDFSWVEKWTEVTGENTWEWQSDKAGIHTYDYAVQRDGSNYRVAVKYHGDLYAAENIGAVNGNDTNGKATNLRIWMFDSANTVGRANFTALVDIGYNGKEFFIDRVDEYSVSKVGKTIGDAINFPGRFEAAIVEGGAELSVVIPETFFVPARGEAQFILVVSTPLADGTNNTALFSHSINNEGKYKEAWNPWDREHAIVFPAYGEYAVKTFAGYASGDVNLFVRLATGEKTLNDIGNKILGRESTDYNAYAMVVCNAEGKVVYVDLRGPGRPAGVKGDVEVPEGGFVIGFNRDVTGYEDIIELKDEKFIANGVKFGDTVKLYGADLAELANATTSALEGVTFDVVPAVAAEPYEITVNVKDNEILTDGKTGFDGAWGTVGTGDVLLVGNKSCTEAPMKVTIIDELASTFELTGYTIDLYHDANVMIGYPEGKAIVSVSTDGTTYTEVGQYDLAESGLALGAHGTVANTFAFDAVQAKFVKVELTVGSNFLTLGGTPADSKYFWEFISIAEVGFAHTPETENILELEAVKGITGVTLTPYFPAAQEKVMIYGSIDGEEYFDLNAGAEAAYTTDFSTRGVVNVKFIKVTGTDVSGVITFTEGEAANASNPEGPYPVEGIKTDANGTHGIVIWTNADVPEGFGVNDSAPFAIKASQITIAQELSNGVYKILWNDTNVWNSGHTHVNTPADVAGIRYENDKIYLADNQIAILNLCSNGTYAKDGILSTAKYITRGLKAGDFVKVAGDTIELHTVRPNPISIFEGEDWKEDWIKAVPGENAGYQNASSTPAEDAAEKDRLLYDYKYFIKDGVLYVGAKFNQPLTRGTGNGNSTFFRVWLKSNPAASAYTHFYDVYVNANDEITSLAKRNKALDANSSEVIADTKSFAYMQEYNGAVEAMIAIPLDEINATDYLRMFVNCAIEKGTGGAAGNQCLISPALAHDENGPLHITGGQNKWSDEVGNVGIILSLVSTPEIPIGDNLALGKPSTYEGSYADSGTYVGDLTDGKSATAGSYNGTWRAFKKGTGSVTIDLGEVKEGINSIRVNIWPANKSGIVAPATVKFYGSEDGTTFVERGLIDTTDKRFADNSDTAYWFDAILFGDFNARYVKMEVVTNGTFSFFAEVEVYAFREAVRIHPTHGYTYATDSVNVIGYKLGKTLGDVKDKTHAWWNLAVVEWDLDEEAYVVKEVLQGDGSTSDFHNVEIPLYGFVLGAHKDAAEATEFITGLKAGDKLYLYDIDVNEIDEVDVALDEDALISKDAIKGQTAFDPEIVMTDYRIPYFGNYDVGDVSIFTRLTSGEKTLGEISAVTVGTAKDYNYYRILVVNANGAIVEINEKLGRADVPHSEGDGRKDLVEVPEGGFIIAIHDNVIVAEGSKYADLFGENGVKLGDKVTLNSIDIKDLEGLTAITALNKYACFSVQRAGYRTVTAANGRWQTVKETSPDLLTYKIALTDDSEWLYVNLIGDGEIATVVDTFRFWIRSSDDATVYTHFYDVDIAADGTVTNKAKYNKSLTANSGDNIADSSMVYSASAAGEGKTKIFFKVKLSEFGGENGFAFYAALHQKDVDYSYYPAPAGTTTATMPYQANSWDIRHEGLYKKDAMEQPGTYKLRSFAAYANGDVNLFVRIMDGENELITLNDIGNKINGRTSTDYNAYKVFTVDADGFVTGVYTNIGRAEVAHSEGDGRKDLVEVPEGGFAIGVSVYDQKDGDTVIRAKDDAALAIFDTLKVGDYVELKNVDIEEVAESHHVSAYASFNVQFMEEVPAGAFSITHFGLYRADICSILVPLATGENTVGAITKVTMGSAQNFTWWYAVIVGADGKVIEKINMVDKTNKVIPEGGFMILAHGSHPALDTLGSAVAGDIVTLYNVDLAALANAWSWKALTGAAFTLREDDSVVRPVSYKKSYTDTGTRHGSYYDDGVKLTDGKYSNDCGNAQAAGWTMASNPTITVDLGEVKSVDLFKIHASANSGWGINLITGFTVEISSDGTNFTAIDKASTKGETDNTYNWQTTWFSVQLDSAVNARYVKFIPVGGNYLWTDEIEVWAPAE